MSKDKELDDMLHKALSLVAAEPEVTTTLVMFTNSRIALMQEMRYHDALLDAIIETTAVEWGDQLAEIATYVGIEVDDWYDPIALTQLELELCKRLKTKGNEPVTITVEVEREE